MTDVAVLAYVPDTFGVLDSWYMLGVHDAQPRLLSAQELSQIVGPVVTYDLAVLIDDLRGKVDAPPAGIVDLSDALRLLVGLSRDDGGERAWNAWGSIRPFFATARDAEAFELCVVGRIERPEGRELERLLKGAVGALIKAWQFVRAELAKAGELERLLTVEWPVQAVFTKRQFKGIAVDSSMATQLLAKLSAEKYDAFPKVAEAIGTNPSGLTFWNLGPHLAQTDLASLGNVEAGGRLQAAFEIASVRSRFAKAFLTLNKAGRDEAVLRRALDGVKRLYPVFSTMGTVTGRILVSDPFLQQLRRPYRTVVCSDAGKELVYFDYAQFEPGVLAGVAGDVAFRDSYNSGDVYRALAEEVLGDARERNTAKRVFLAFLYGMSSERLALLLGGCPGDATGSEMAIRIERFFAAYPGLRLYRAAQEALLLERGYVTSALGNRRRRSSRGPLTSKERRWAVNQPIQSTASLIFKDAILAIAAKYGEESVVLPMHDAVLMEVGLDQDREAIKTAVSDLMVRAFERHVPGVRIRVTTGPFAS